MIRHPHFAPIAALIAEPPRAVMLAELLGGRALTATELAAGAEVAPSTASAHLAKLVAGSLLSVEVQGRHRYYRLAGREVARALETLGVLVGPPLGEDPFERAALHELRFARTCYDHLAGQLGVAMRCALLERGILREDGVEHRVTGRGEAWFAAFGVDLQAARRARRSFARRCLDWTERRPHLAGALGAALLGRLVDRAWVTRRCNERALDLTLAGRSALARELGLRF